MLLDITHLCNRSTMITIILIKEDTEKLCIHHMPINKLNLIKERNSILAYRIFSRDTLYAHNVFTSFEGISYRESSLRVLKLFILSKLIKKNLASFLYNLPLNVYTQNHFINFPANINNFKFIPVLSAKITPT